jgi:hypothetical protein
MALPLSGRFEKCGARASHFLYLALAWTARQHIEKTRIKLIWRKEKGLAQFLLMFT